MSRGLTAPVGAASTEFFSLRSFGRPPGLPHRQLGIRLFFFGGAAQLATRAVGAAWAWRPTGDGP
eukprot:1168929-Pyramimonas_sp.AAC.1